MGYFGTVQDGKIILDDGVVLPEGTRVTVTEVSAAADEKPEKSSLVEGLLTLAETKADLPPDAARNYKHYLYGHPKK